MESPNSNIPEWRRRNSQPRMDYSPSKNYRSAWSKPQSRYNMGPNKLETVSSSNSCPVYKGKLITINTEGGYGFLAPSHGGGDNVYTRIDSGMETGLMNPQVRDIFEYTLNDRAERCKAKNARLVRCSPRTLDEKISYAEELLRHGQQAPSTTLKEVRACPAGFVLVLNIHKPPSDLVIKLLELAQLLVNDTTGVLSLARVKQFYRLFNDTRFTRFSLVEALLDDKLDAALLMPFLTNLAQHSPESISSTLPLLHHLSSDERGCPRSFFVELIAKYAACDKFCSFRRSNLVPGADDDDGIEGLPSLKTANFSTVEDYVETHFKLLKEDCYFDLKKRICKIRSQGMDAAGDDHVLSGGTVVGVHFGARWTGITLGVKFPRSRRTRLPLPGYLVCLSDSCGAFESPVWGVIAQSENFDEYRYDQWPDRTLVQCGFVIFVEIIGGGDGMCKLMASTSITVLTSNIFYLAYGPVLKALQRLYHSDIPFTRELVSCDWPHRPPPYLEDPSATLDWSCLFSTCTEIRSSVDALDDLLSSGHKTTLDETQIAAVNLALKNRLALIHGPPGTGKTFVASKILQLLLSASTLPDGPVLVITYKNQALDNFSRECLKFCDSLVRIGGGSKDKDLAPYTLYEVIGKLEVEDLLGVAEHKETLAALQNNVEVSCRKVMDIEEFDVEKVLTHMPDGQLREFLCGSLQSKHSFKDFPEDVPILETIRMNNGFGEIIRNCIRHWMPTKQDFEMVENCYSLRKQEPLRSSSHRYRRTEEVANEEDDSDEEDLLSQAQFLNVVKEKETSWLSSRHYFPTTRACRSSTFKVKPAELPVDLSHYEWLFNRNPWELNAHCRVLLVHVILQKAWQDSVNSMTEAMRIYEAAREDTRKLDLKRQLKLLRKKKIVCMTTTGVAMYKELLNYLKPAIVFVEEASEIMEAQLLAVLEQSMQHLILFGDHFQLSPRVACNDLDRSHDTGLSMFQRLVEKEGVPFQTLNVQGRMREDFVPMLFPIYPNLRSNKELVSGIRNTHPSSILSPMYVWSHSHSESLRNKSYCNEGEAKMCAFLVNWLLAEGESSTDITILAAYTAQVKLLRTMLARDENPINIHSIDRYQGSESRIIILSVVRSNEEGRIGFLAKRNRLCVAVSRARGAFYVCANISTFTTKTGHWKYLIENFFLPRSCVGEEIHLRCQRHPEDKPFTVKSMDVPHQTLLCPWPCNSYLECGHTCKSTCHHRDAVKHPICTETVDFVFKICGHEGSRQCDQEEGRCKKEVNFTYQPCGHDEFVECWKTRSKIKCMRKCMKDLECGHPCSLSCYQDCKTGTCLVCEEIEKERIRREKEREIQEIKDKMQKLEKKIKEMELQPKDNTTCIEIDSEGEYAAEYLNVKDRTERLIQPKHGFFPVVIKVEKIHSPKLKLNFLEAKKDLLKPTAPSQLLFHETSEESIQGIIQCGFKLPRLTDSTKNMYGRGIYFATDSSKSAKEIYNNGASKLLLCKVLVGKPLSVDKVDPEMSKENLQKKGCDSLFSKRDGKEKGDMFVVYDSRQALPKYIVHYHTLKYDLSSSKAMSTFQSNQNVTRIKYDMSRTFSADDPAEYHFRLAESQFFRMSSRQEFKVESVELIINRELQGRYEKAKEEMEKKMGKEEVEEMLVFHGTEKEAIDKIVEGGFKVGGDGVPVRHGKAYGRGVYTALDPSTAQGYSGGSMMMLLSRVIVGQEGVHFNKGGSADVLVIRDPVHLLPNYVVHYARKSP